MTKGRVVSVKLKNTATVLVERIDKHPLYKKTYIQSKRYLVDDGLGVKEGDIVEIINCKPISKNKHWKIVKVIGKSLEEMNEQKLKDAAEKTIAEVMPEEAPSPEATAPEEKKKGKKDGAAQK